MELRNEPNVRQEQRLVRIIIASTVLIIILGGAFFFIGNFAPSTDTLAANDNPETYYISGSVSNSKVKDAFENCKDGDTIYINKKLTVNKESEELGKTDVIIVVDGTEMYWTAKNSFFFGEGSKILLKNGGEITVKKGSCNGDAGIYFGSTKKVSCDGTDADLDFDDVNKAGGVQMSGITALPVELLRFETQRTENTVEIDWATASELNNSHFDIERSSDGKIWKKIGTVPGNGNSQKVIAYHYQDQTAELGKLLYYRLKQTDFDGAFEYSFVRTVSDKMEESASLTSVYPNPVDKFLNVKIDDFGTFQILLLDQVGQLKFQTETAQSLETINTSIYPAGIYYVTIQNDRLKESHKIVIKH